MPDASPIDTTPPAEYLHQDPTHDEHILAEQCQAHDGAHVPWWRFAKVVLRVHRHAVWTSAIDVVLRRARRYVLAAVSAAALNLSGLGIWYIHRVETNATAAERAAELERRFHEYRDSVRLELQELRLDVRELRAAMRRLSGAGPEPPISDTPTIPDTLSRLDTKGHDLCCLSLDLALAIRSQPSL